MSFSLKNSKIVVILSVIILLILLLSLFGLNAKSNSMFKKNRELTEEISRLAIKASVLTEKLNTDMSESIREKAELEKTRNKLTQERLKNRQLLQRIEELEEA
jgi:hypothetical protein